MTEQEENWELMTILSLPWSESKKLSKDDRKFLLERAAELKEFLAAQQAAEAAAQGSPEGRGVMPELVDFKK